MRQIQENDGRTEEHTPTAKWEEWKRTLCTRGGYFIIDGNLILADERFPKLNRIELKTYLKLHASNTRGDGEVKITIRSLAQSNDVSEEYQRRSLKSLQRYGLIYTARDAKRAGVVNRYFLRDTNREEMDQATHTPTPALLRGEFRSWRESLLRGERRGYIVLPNAAIERGGTLDRLGNTELKVYLIILARAKNIKGRSTITEREIAERLGISTRYAEMCVKSLKEKRLILTIKGPGNRNSYQLLPLDEAPTRQPKGESNSHEKPQTHTPQEGEIYEELRRMREEIERLKEKIEKLSQLYTQPCASPHIRKGEGTEKEVDRKWERSEDEVPIQPEAEVPICTKRKKEKIQQRKGNVVVGDKFIEKLLEDYRSIENVLPSKSDESFLREIADKFGREAVQKVISAFRQEISRARNPRGWIVASLRGGWEPPISPHERERVGKQIKIESKREEMERFLRCRLEELQREERDEAEVYRDLLNESTKGFLGEATWRRIVEGSIEKINERRLSRCNIADDLKRSLRAEAEESARKTLGKFHRGSEGGRIFQMQVESEYRRLLSEAGGVKQLSAEDFKYPTYQRDNEYTAA
ncbi:MAG: hypothetical protein ACUVXI_01700 [bacterium]